MSGLPRALHLWTVELNVGTCGFLCFETVSFAVCVLGVYVLKSNTKLSRIARLSNFYYAYRCSVRQDGPYDVCHPGLSEFSSAANRYYYACNAQAKVDKFCKNFAIILFTPSSAKLYLHLGS